MGYQLQLRSLFNGLVLVSQSLMKIVCPLYPCMWIIMGTKCKGRQDRLWLWYDNRRQKVQPVEAGMLCNLESHDHFYWWSIKRPSRVFSTWQPARGHKTESIPILPQVLSVSVQQESCEKTEKSHDWSWSTSSGVNAGLGWFRNTGWFRNKGGSEPCLAFCPSGLSWTHRGRRVY